MEKVLIGDKDFKWLNKVGPGMKLVNKSGKIETNYVTLHNGIAYENNLTINIVQIDSITNKVSKIILSRESFSILKTLEDI